MAYHIKFSLEYKLVDNMKVKKATKSSIFCNLIRQLCAEILEFQISSLLRILIISGIFNYRTKQKFL